MKSPSVKQLAAQIRALKFQGAMLVTERNAYLDWLMTFEETVDQLLAVHQHTVAKFESLEQELAACRDSRHGLLIKLRDCRRGQR